MTANQYHDNWLNMYLRRPFDVVTPNQQPTPGASQSAANAFLGLGNSEDKGAASTVDFVGFSNQIQVRYWSDEQLGSSAPDLWRAGEMLFVGDSQLIWFHDQTTYSGTGFYFDQMVNQGYIGPGMRNMSAPGLTFIGAERLIDQLRINGPTVDKAPSALVIQLGNADLAITWNICQSERAQSLETSLEYMNRAMGAAKRFQQRYNCPVYIVSIHPNADPLIDVNDWDWHFNRGLSQLARQMGFVYIDTFSQALNNEAATVREMYGISVDGSDPSHFNFRGYYIFREIMFSHLFPTVTGGATTPLSAIPDIGFRQLPYSTLQQPGLSPEEYRWFLVATPFRHITQIRTNAQLPSASIALYNPRGVFSPTNANGQWYGTPSGTLGIIQTPTDFGERKEFLSLVAIGTPEEFIDQQTVEVTHLFPVTDGSGVPIPGGFSLSGNNFTYNYTGATYPNTSGMGLLGFEFGGPRVQANTGGTAETEYYSRWLSAVVPPFSEFTLIRSQANCPDLLGIDFKLDSTESAPRLSTVVANVSGSRRETYTNATGQAQLLYILVNFRTATPRFCADLTAEVKVNPAPSGAGTFLKFY
ncbi:MAG: hypothetical protein SFY68_09415 [Candidatus Sumerlaeia bacterium]|nr:hypothetical protein [Candidatus Sumerlaeia bacterium]